MPPQNPTIISVSQTHRECSTQHHQFAALPLLREAARRYPGPVLLQPEEYSLAYLSSCPQTELVSLSSVDSLPLPTG